MLYLCIYIALFIGTLIYAVWDSHNKVKRIPFKDGYPSFLGLKTKEPAWFLLLVSAIVAPFIIPLLIVGGVYRLYRKIHYHNRPRPVSKGMRQYLKADTVLDEDNSTMSLAEYNRKHHSNFTLEQVYGKKYVDSIPQEEKELFETEQGKFEVAENITPCTYKDLCKAFVDAYRAGDIASFTRYLADDVKLIRYGKGTTVGIDNFVKYWQNQYDYQKNITIDHKIIFLPFWAQPVVEQFIHGQGSLYIVFRIENNRITHVIYTPEPDEGHTGGHSLLELPYNKQYIEEGISDSMEPLENHYPCMHCGTPSERLNWYHFSTHNNTPHEYAGDISVCPVCGRETEFRTYIRMRMEVQSSGDFGPFTGSESCEIDHPEKGQINAFAAIGHEYIANHLQQALETVGNCNFIFDHLTCLHLAPNCDLFLHEAETEGTGDNSCFVIRVPESKRDRRDLWADIEVEVSEMGAWQMYLLEHARNVLPAFWHGGYDIRKYIFGTRDMESIRYIRNHDWSLLGTIEELLPKVTIEGEFATVTCCFWNDWQGLVRETIKYQFSMFEIMHLKRINEHSEILYPYKSPICF